MKIFYFTDVMCVWCYGISQTVTKIYDKYHDKIDFEIVPGGMLTGDDIVTVNPKYSDMVSSHILKIEKQLGVTFGEKYKENILNNVGTVLESLTGSKSLLTFNKFLPNKVFEYEEKLQYEQYVNGNNLSDLNVFLDCASEYGITKDDFLAVFHSQEIEDETKKCFQMIYDWQIQYYPTLYIEKDGKREMLSEAGVTFEELDKKIATYL